MLENVGYQGILHLWLASRSRLIFLRLSLGSFENTLPLSLQFQGRTEQVPLTPGDGKSQIVWWFSEDT